MNIAPSNNGSTEFLNFSDALHHLRWGNNISRREWKGGAELVMNYNGEVPDFVVVYNHSPRGMDISLESRDIMAEDWYVV